MTFGTANDNTHTSTSFFGVLCDYTSTRSDKFFFDDISIAEGDNSTELALSALEQQGSNSMELTFNQEVDQASAELESNYTLSGIGNPTSAVLNSTDATKVMLSFSNLSNLNYRLTVNEVANVDQTSTADELTIGIKMNRNFSTGAIVINEILADPEQGLQESEYLELLSRSNRPIDLEGFELEGYGNTLGSFVLQPGAYVIISTSAEDFTVPSLDISSGALTNGGELLTLKDANGNIVDQVDYDDAWYTEGFPGDGYSLERINPGSDCPGSSNWGSSTASSGGTPGARNSIFGTAPDTSAPSLLSFEVIAPDTVVIELTEQITQTAANSATFALTPDIRIADEIVENDLSDEIILVLRDDLISEANYALTLDNIEDCVGNRSDQFDTTFYYDITPPSIVDYYLKSVNQIDLIFSEEVSSSSVQEEDFLLDNLLVPADESVDSLRVSLFFDSTFTVGQAYEVTVTAIEDLYDNEITIEDDLTFTYKDELDTVFVVAPNALEVVFSKEVSPGSAAVLEHYLLDDETPPVLAGQVEGEPNHVRLFFTENFGENRELELDIEDLLDANGDRIITPIATFIYDTRAPELEEITVIDENSILLHFDERLESVAAEISNNYELNGEDFALSSQLQSAMNSVQLDFAANFPVEEEQTLSISGLSDLLGNQMTRTTNTTFVYDTLGPRVDSVRLLSESLIEIAFSEVVDFTTATEISNYDWDEGTNPIKVERMPYDSSIVRLQFGSTLSKGAEMSLKIEGVSDIQSNLIEEAIDLSVNNLNPYLSDYKFMNDSTLVLNFSTGIDPATADIEIDDVGFAINNATANQLTLHLDAPLPDNSELQISINSIQSISGDASLDSQNIDAAFNSQFMNFEIREDRVIDLVFESELGPFEAGVFSSTKELVTISQDGEEPNVVRLFLVDPLMEGDMLMLSWGGLVDVSGRALPDFKIGIPFDQTPPVVIAFEPLLTDQLMVQFSEPVNEATALALNHYLLSDSIAPAEVSLVTDSTVLLAFADQFIGDTSYQLLVSTVQDRSGNSIADTTLTFNYVAPYVPIPGDLEITEIMADPTPVVGLPEYEYIEIHNTSTETINLFQVTLSDFSGSFLLPNVEVLPGQYAIILDDSRESEFESFGLTVPLASFPSLGNSGDSLVLSVEGNVVDRVVYSSTWYRDGDKNDGGYSLERIGIENGCDESTDWAASLSVLGGTPGAANSLMGNFVDSIAPDVEEVVLDQDQILIVFSEALDPATVMISDFEFPLGIATVSFGEGSSDLILQLAEGFPVGNEFNLSIEGLADCLGNTIADTSFSIALGRPPGFNELIITEIMADPEPTRGLPIAEYLELYNPTDALISTADITLSDGSSETTLPAFNIAAGAYIILTPNSSVSLFEAFGEVAGVSSWPSLNNGGEEVSLTLDGNLIFSVDYSDEWYKSDEAAEGGVSLQMIDPANPCGEINNWTASEAAPGGSPGIVNSVDQPNPDSFGPVLEQVVAPDNRSTVLSFDEKLSTNTSLWAFEISPAIGISGALLSDDRKRITLGLTQELALNQPYDLWVAGMTDCLGNFIDQESPFSFVLPEAAAPGDILINEVLFNPRTGGVDFVEVYNASQKYINFRFWFTSNDPTNETLVPLSIDNNIIPPGDLAAFTVLPDVLKDQYPQGNFDKVFLAPIPTMPNDEGRIAFISADTTLIDAFDYSEDFHTNLLNDVDGVSLERISIASPTGNSDNWQSASSTVGFATPGLINSQSRNLTEASTKLQIEPKVFIPGTVNGFTTISYEDDQAGSFASVIVYDVEGRVVRQLAQNELLASNGFFTWDGTDESGSKARTGIYVVYFELYNATGEVEIIRETVVLGATF
ncbi:MAG: lamin tail domain-containing protein [Bacteroidota bacterium]